MYLTRTAGIETSICGKKRTDYHRMYLTRSLPAGIQQKYPYRDFLPVGVFFLYVVLCLFDGKRNLLFSALLFDVQHLDAHGLADLQLVVNGADKVVCDFTDVYQSAAAVAQIDKRAVRL